MIGEQKLKQISQKVLNLSTADQTEVILSASESGLTRFANSQIHQNVAWENIWISVRVVFSKKIGSASDNCFDEKSLQVLLQKAEKIAKLQQDDTDFMSLPSPHAYATVKQQIVDLSPEEKAEGVRHIIAAADRDNFIASGAFQDSKGEVAIANSLGVWAYHCSSSAEFSTIITGPTSTGFAAAVGKSARDIDAKACGAKAVGIARESSNPIDIEPGKYEVILEPQAVSELMAFFAIYAPNARLYYENASFLSGKIGQQVLGKNITLIDNPIDNEMAPMPFDFEGYPKRKLTLMENGVLENIVYDSYTAQKYKQENTGHALPAPNTFGPVPLHLMMLPGNKTREAMIKSIKRGLLVTRLWYVRVVHPRTLEITGMTRDGTFLIENGKIIRGVKNLRFNQSIPEALNNVVALENKCTYLSSFEGEMGISCLPAIHIKEWNFTSGTLF